MPSQLYNGKASFCCQSQTPIYLNKPTALNLNKIDQEDYFRDPFDSRIVVNNH